MITMKKTKWLAMLLIIFGCAFTLSACGGGDDDNEDEPEINPVDLIGCWKEESPDTDGSAFYLVLNGDGSGSAIEVDGVVKVFPLTWEYRNEKLIINYSHDKFTLTILSLTKTTLVTYDASEAGDDDSTVTYIRVNKSDVPGI